MEGKTLAFATILSGLVVVVIGVAVLYAGGPPPAPTRPQAIPVGESMMNSGLKFSEPIYRGVLDGDAKRYGVPVVSPAAIREPNGYYEEWKGHRKLKARGGMDTAHLKISLQLSKERASTDGQVFTVDHLVLRIENKSPRFLAYRIETAVDNKKKCANKGDVPHNAIVIEPLQTIVRTECLYRTDVIVDVTHVEVMEIHPLSAVYVSRLPPTLVLYDVRTAAGHLPTKGKLCEQTFSWREIREGADRNELGWRDVIDFYTRHNCDEYTFFKSYRFRTDTGAPLPARPPEGGG